MGTKEDRPCGTPGAVYGTVLEGDMIKLDVELPQPILNDLSEAERQGMIRDLHNGILPVVERLFSRVWLERFAGQPDEDGQPFPERHDQLFGT